MAERREGEKGVLRLLSEEDSKKYAGQHVCVVSFQDNTVVSANEYPAVARREAREKGYSDPVCFRVSYTNEKDIF
jgi:hypothetical protein